MGTRANRSRDSLASLRKAAPDVDWYAELAHGEGRASAMPRHLRDSLMVSVESEARERQARIDAERDREEAIRQAALAAETFSRSDCHSHSFVVP